MLCRVEPDQCKVHEPSMYFDHQWYNLLRRDSFVTVWQMLNPKYNKNLISIRTDNGVKCITPSRKGRLRDPGLYKNLTRQVCAYSCIVHMQHGIL